MFSCQIYVVVHMLIWLNCKSQPHIRARINMMDGLISSSNYMFLGIYIYICDKIHCLKCVFRSIGTHS